MNYYAKIVNNYSNNIDYNNNMTNASTLDSDEQKCNTRTNNMVMDMKNACNRIRNVM